MVPLDKGDYARVRPVFEGLRYNLVVDSVLDGNTPGWVYVDDVHHPQTAWMWDMMDAMLLAGRADDDGVNRALARLMSDVLIRDERVLPNTVIPMLSLHYFPEEWEGKMDVVLHGKGAHKAWRRFYTFGRLKIDWRKEMPAACQMRRIDEELLESTHVGNARDVAGWVRSFWASYRDFVEAGFGFCLVERAPEPPPGRRSGAREGRGLGAGEGEPPPGRGLGAGEGRGLRAGEGELLESAHLGNARDVAGWVRSFWASYRDFVETSFGFCLVERAPEPPPGRGLGAGERRGRGYATLTAAACVEHCVEHGLTPHWHCWEDNAPSIRVAEKVGFERPERYTVYRFEW